MLQRQYSFDHCLKVDALSPTGILVNDWISTSGFTARQSNASNGTGGIISLDGWLAFGITPSWYSSAGAYTVFSMLSKPSTGKKFTLGFRVRSWVAYNGAEDVVGLTVNNAGSMVVLSYADLLAARPAGTVSEFYIELVFDTVANTKEIWANGVLLKTVSQALNATLLAGFAAGTIEFYLAQTRWIGSVCTQWYKDIYVTDDIVTADDSFVGRLGPQIMLPVYIDQATGPWVSDDGATDLKSTLNASIPATAQLVSPGNKDPLTLSLSCAVPDGYKVNNVALTLAARSLGDVATKTRFEVSQGGSTVAPIDIVSQRAMSYNQKILSMPLAPDGGLWSAAKIDQTTIVLRPDQ